MPHPLLHPTSLYHMCPLFPDLRSAQKDLRRAGQNDDSTISVADGCFWPSASRRTSGMKGHAVDKS